MKCFKHLILLFFGLAFFNLTTAQKRAIVYGTVTNPNSRSVKIKYQPNDINGSEVVTETDLDFNGEYALALEITTPRPAILSYDNKEMLLFISPDNSLELNFDNDDFINSMKFDGYGFNDNSFLHRYIQKFGMRDKFNEAIVAPLSIPNNIFEKMNELNPDDFIDFVAVNQDTEHQFYLNDPIQRDLSEELKGYIEALIKYRWASYLFTYANLRENRGDTIPDEFYVFIWDLELSNDKATIQPEYGYFLDVYLNYAFVSMYGKTDTISNFERFAKTYELAERQLSDDAEEFMIGRLLARNIKPTNIPFITAYYEKFMRVGVVNHYKKAVTDVYERAVAFSDQQSAPDFTLMNNYGDTVSLSDYQDKLIYLSFWASWCQPCIAEQEESLSNRAELQEQDIVFLYISLDEKKDSWKQFLERKPNYGVNVWAEGRQTDLTRQYNVISLPHYFLLDKKGRFITNFKKASDPSFIFEIKKLLK